MHDPKFVSGGLLDERHKPPNLILGPTPILRRKSVNGQISDAEFARVQQHLSKRSVAFSMPEQSSETFALRPTAVPIHDDGDVEWQLGKIDSFSNGLFLRGIQWSVC